MINWKTVVLVVAILTALCVCAYLKVGPEYVAAIGALGTVVAGVLKSAFETPAK